MTKRIDDIIDIFWKEFKDYTNCSGPFIYQIEQFENDDAHYGRCHIWHEISLVLFT